MESKADLEEADLELVSLSVETKKVTPFTNEQNRSCSTAPPRDSATTTMAEGGMVKTWLRTEIVVLCIMMVIVWVLLSLPIIFYHLPETDSEISEETDSEELVCTPYMGDVCKDALQSQQDCLPDRLGSSDIYISLLGGENQDDIEVQARMLLDGLKIIRASPECEKAVLPFLCLYLFSLCDSNGTLYQPSSMDCVTISTDVCEREWMTAINFFGPGVLPQCESLPSTSLMCENVTSNITSDVTSDSSNTTGGNCSIECRDGFYINTTLCACLPRCDTWEQYPHSTTVATDFFVVLSAAIGLIAGIAVLVISCIRWKRIFVFPSVFTIYMTITAFVLAFVLLISYVDRSELFCSSIDLAQSLANTTSFCVFAGIVLYYVLLQLAVWWFFHVVALFWKIKFPLHARAVESAHKLRYVHLTMVVLGLILPLVPVIAPLATTGFGRNRFPPILCGATNANALFYSLVLPIILLLQVGITLLVVIFWTIHKQQGLFRMRLSRSPFQIETAEKKILIIFCYFVVLGAIALTSFSLATKGGDRVSKEISGYFTCELPGVDPEKPCDRSRYQALLYPELSCLSYVLLGLFPAVNLIYAVNIEELKQWFGRARRFHLPSISGKLSSIAGTSTADSTSKRTKLSAVTSA